MVCRRFSIEHRSKHKHNQIYKLCQSLGHINPSSSSSLHKKLEEALGREAMFEAYLTKFKETFQAKGFDTKSQVNQQLACWGGSGS
jgi:hypothetical protein